MAASDNEPTETLDELKAWANTWFDDIIKKFNQSNKLNIFDRLASVDDKITEVNIRLAEKSNIPTTVMRAPLEDARQRYLQQRAILMDMLK